MKPYDEWDEAYILGLPPGEHDWVEFKNALSLDFDLPGSNEGRSLDELSKQVSAFANSGGGALVVVAIPSSEGAPHQAKDNVYYGRVAGKSRPLGHRFVMDIINRPKHPKMVVTCRINPQGRYSGRKGRNVPTLSFYCRNAGRVYANYVNGYVWVPLALASLREEEDAVEDEMDGKKHVRKYFDNTVQEVVGQVDRYYGPIGGTMKEAVYVSRYEPVLPSRGFGFSVALSVPVDELTRCVRKRGSRL